MAATTGPTHAGDAPHGAAPLGARPGPVAGNAPDTAPALRRLSLGRPWLVPTAVGAVSGLAIAYTAWQDPNGDGIFPQCPTRVVFGFDCPGCGGLRAVHSLAHGHIAEAFDHNVLVAVVVPLLVVAWAVWLVRSLRSTWAGRHTRDDADRPMAAEVPFPLRFPDIGHPVWKVTLAGLLAFTIVRNIDSVPLFEYLHSDAVGPKG